MNKNILNKNSVKDGDQVIAVASSGIHSNGYSLVRKIIDKRSIDIFQKIQRFKYNKTRCNILLKCHSWKKYKLNLIYMKKESP